MDLDAWWQRLRQADWKGRAVRVGRFSVKLLGAWAILLALLGLGGVLFTPWDDPLELHLGIDPATGAYTITWVTHDSFAPVAIAKERVTFAAEGAEPTRASVTDEMRYETADSLLWLREATVHRARLPDLAAGARYRYEVGAGVNGTFHVPGADNITFAVFGDMGIGADAGRMVHVVAGEQPDLVLVAGDLAYAAGDSRSWQAWFDLMAPLALRAPVVPAYGNHDLDGLFRQSRYVDSRFGLEERYFSYDLGPVHFVHLDTETSLSGEDERPDWLKNDDHTRAQTRWLERDLVAARNSGTPWIVAVFHEPVYNSGRVHGVNDEARAQWLALFDRYAVDLVLQAHEHDYERTYALRQGEVPDANLTSIARGVGTVYVVTGGGGAPLYGLWPEEAPPWSAVRATAHEALVVRADLGRLSVWAVGLEGEVIDRFSIG